MVEVDIPPASIQRTVSETWSFRINLAHISGDHPYKEDAFNQDAKANYVDKVKLWNRGAQGEVDFWIWIDFKRLRID